MEKNLAIQITESLNELGFEASFNDNYSGRFMYGETTCGVVGDFDICDVIGVIINDASNYVNKDGSPKFEVEDIMQDSMGIGSIIY